MKVVAIIQARMGSTRLTGKVLKDLYGRPVLDHVLERVRQSKGVDQVIIATTVHTNDQPIVEFCKSNDVSYFRGSEEDVLSRYYFAAKESGADIVIRITSDCPLIDPNILDELLEFYLKNDYDVVTNAGADLTKRTYPRGLDTEIFSFSILAEAYKNANERYQREHVTPYLYEKYERIYHYMNDMDYSNLRWTLDTSEDFQLISLIYEELYKGVHDFYLSEILHVFDEHPDYFEINAHVEQKKLRE